MPNLTRLHATAVRPRTHFLLPLPLLLAALLLMAAAAAPDPLPLSLACLSWVAAGGSRWRCGPIDDLIGEELDLDIKFTEPALAAAAAAATFRRLWQRLSADSFRPRAS